MFAVMSIKHAINNTIAVQKRLALDQSFTRSVQLQYGRQNTERSISQLTGHLQRHSDISILKIVPTSHSNSILVRQYPFLF